MSRPGTAPPRGRPDAWAERRGSEGRGARGGPEEGRWHRWLGLGALRKSRAESCERLQEACLARSGAKSGTRGPGATTSPPATVQPRSPRRRPPMEFT